MPAIQRDLGFTPAGLSWTVNAYLIAFGGLLLPAGRFGDLIGRKKMFVTGNAVFTAASRTGNQLAAGASEVAALTGGYRLAFAVAAGLLATALVVAVTVLRRPTVATDSAPDQLVVAA
ncbi:MFS transporter [Nocardia sp. NBC_01388]|uniref:MFS transporter n=1 Tax=Nocardia sp. NBC_01388 TaxID=2903596 RepID=UPI0032554D24